METTALTFAEPQWLWLLAIVPLLAVLFLWSHRRGRLLVSRVVAPRLREQLAGSVSVPRRVFRALCLTGALGLAVVALAQPRLGVIEHETKHRGRDVIIAVDTSKSMMATDVQPNRLARAKLLTRDLVRLLAGDRVGLVAFAGSAFLQAPLTLDDSAIVNSLEELDTSVIPRGGTNIAAAIDTALEAFGKAEGMSRALVVLTDGEELDADGVAAAKRAAAEGVRIFTVGIGSAEGAPIPRIGPRGTEDVVRDDSGKPVMSRLDEARLREIAEAAGGFYVPIGPDAAREIFQGGIVPMEMEERGVMTTKKPIERYQWPLGAALVLLVSGILPGERRGRRAAGVIVAVCAMLPGGVRADATGIDAWREGDFDRAGGIFRRHLEERPDSPAIRFNAGGAAYKTGDFDRAVEDFTGALLAEDPSLRADAAYNLGNALVRSGEAATDIESKKSKWEAAIEQYDAALELEPGNAEAQANRRIVEQMLEELNQQQQESQQQDSENQDQSESENDSEGESGSDSGEGSESGGGESGDEQESDEQQSDEQQSDEQQSDEQQSDEQQSDDGAGEPGSEDESGGDDTSEEGSEESSGGQDEQRGGESPAPVPTPTPGDRKEGDLTSADQGEAGGEESASDAEAMAVGEPVDAEGMSPEQARALLNALRGEERKVNLMEQQTSQPVIRDW